MREKERERDHDVREGQRCEKETHTTSERESE